MAFWHRTFGGNPFFPLKGRLLPPFFGEKKVPTKFTKRSPRKISQNAAPAKSYSTQNTDRIYRPASASNLPIPAKLPVYRWDATLICK